jgi:hypothetical protein
VRFRQYGARMKYPPWEDEISLEGWDICKLNDLSGCGVLLEETTSCMHQFLVGVCVGEDGHWLL